MDSGVSSSWGLDWAWGLPLIVLTVLLHAHGLGAIGKEVHAKLIKPDRSRKLSSSLTYIIGGTALSVTILHGFEGVIWAGAYRLLGALPDDRSAMLFSLNALTSYGHANLQLSPGWEMMGGLRGVKRLDSFWT